MAKSRALDWMTGDETWSHLKLNFPEQTDRDLRIMLHAAVRCGRVEARLAGRNARETALAAKGLVGDIEGDWFRNFVDSDPDYVAWPDILNRTEFSRRDMAALAKMPRGPGSRASDADVKAAVEEYVKSEKARNRATSTKRALAFVKEVLPKATREQCLKALDAIQGGRRQRGRARNP